MFILSDPDCIRLFCLGQFIFISVIRVMSKILNVNVKNENVQVWLKFLNTVESLNNGHIEGMVLSVVESSLLRECLTITYGYGKLIPFHEVYPL